MAIEEKHFKFKGIIEEYNKTAEPGLRAERGQAHYREIYLYDQNLPNSIHYEFHYDKDTGNFRTELHLQKADIAYLADTLKKFHSRSLPKSEGLILYSDDYPKIFGKLVVEFDHSVPSEKIATAMKELIELTLDAIEEKYKEGAP